MSISGWARGVSDDTVVVAVDVGGTSAKGGVMDATGALSAVSTVPLAHLRSDTAAVDAIVSFAAHLVDDARANLGERAVSAVGLGVPGIIDSVAGVGVSSMIMGWRDVPFVQLLSQATGLPVGFGHDVRLAARAETEVGAGHGHDDFLFMTLGTGVGAAFILDGRIYTGAHGLGGELAHFVVEPGGPVCRCGKRGCLEMVSSAEAVGVNYTALGPGRRPANAEQVAAAAAGGDPIAIQVWRRAVDGLAVALSAYAEIMDPELIVVGGGMSAAGPALFEPLAAALQSGVSLSHVPSVVPGALGHLAGVYGAGLAAHDQLASSLPRAALGSTATDS